MDRNCRIYAANKQNMKRSKSLPTFLHKGNSNMEAVTPVVGQQYFAWRRSSGVRSDSSFGVFVAHDTSSLGSECSVDGAGEAVHDSGIDPGMEGRVLAALEQKIEMLSDLFKEQSKVMSDIKEDLKYSKMKIEDYEPLASQLVMEVLQKAFSSSSSEAAGRERGDLFAGNTRARSLLDAIEQKQASALEREIRHALSNFLQSEELKERMVSATVASLKEVVTEPLRREVSAVYLPALRRSHRHLVNHVSQVLDRNFKHLERQVSLTKPMQKTSHSIHKVLEDYHNWLRDSGFSSRLVSSLQHTIQQTMESELRQHRGLLLSMMSPSEDVEERWERVTSPGPVPRSPAQPADPDSSVIDQLMKSAEINKQIQDGDVNGSFEKALSASDLSLVMVACRAVDPSIVFDPGQLEHSVLLSLVQQLATDMVHETQLKCRYLEEAMICLNSMSLSTRPHLPLVVEEVRTHLTAFLSAYPSHVASRRIKLIIMAADHLLH